MLQKKVQGIYKIISQCKGVGGSKGGQKYGNGK